MNLCKKQVSKLDSKNVCCLYLRLKNTLVGGITGLKQTIWWMDVSLAENTVCLGSLNAGNLKKKRVNIWTVSFRREFRLFKMFSLRFLWSCTGQRLVSQMRANFLSFSQKCLSLKHHWNYNCRSHFVHSDRCFKTTAQTLRIARTDGEKLDSKWWQIWVTCSPN